MQGGTLSPLVDHTNHPEEFSRGTRGRRSIHVTIASPFNRPSFLTTEGCGGNESVLPAAKNRRQL